MKTINTRIPNQYVFKNNSESAYQEHIDQLEFKPSSFQNLVPNK